MCLCMVVLSNGFRVLQKPIQHEVRRLQHFTCENTKHPSPHFGQGNPPVKKGSKVWFTPTIQGLKCLLCFLCEIYQTFPNNFIKPFSQNVLQNRIRMSITLHLRTITYSKILHRRGKVFTCSFTTPFPPPSLLLDPSQEHPHTLMEEYQGITVSKVMPASRVCFYVCIMYNHANDVFYLTLVYIVRQVGEYVFP